MCVEAADLFANLADLFSHVPADFSSKNLQTIERRVFDIHHILEPGNTLSRANLLCILVSNIMLKTSFV